MLRTALFRSVAAFAVRRSATRSLSSTVSSSRPVGLSSSKKMGWPAVWRTSGARTYASDSGLTKEDVEGRILGLLAGFDKVNDPSNIKPTAHFANDLGLDSLDTVEVVMAIEEEFSIEIPDKDADAIHSVEKAVEYILSQPGAT